MNLDSFVNSKWGSNECCVIYKFTNIVNNKVYIGKTKGSLRKRIIAHLSHSRNTNKAPKHYFQRAIQKYGTVNFDIDIIEHCVESQLNNREKFWIRFYNSKNPYLGYNCTDGGDGCCNITYTQEYKNKISKSNKKVWSDPLRRQNILDSRRKHFLNTTKKVVQLDYNYNLIKLWNYKKEAQQAVKVDLGRLNNKTKICRAKHYLWMYLDDYNKLDLSTPLIVQLDYNYNLISKFYDYKSADAYLFELTGQYGNLRFTANQKFTKDKGTKKGGYIWMMYSNYLKKIKLK